MYRLRCSVGGIVRKAVLQRFADITQCHYEFQYSQSLRVELCSAFLLSSLDSLAVPFLDLWVSDFFPGSLFLLL